MDQSVLIALSGSLVPLILAVVALIQNQRTLKASQPKTDAQRLAAEAEQIAAESEKQKNDIESLRGIIAELRQARDDDRLRFTQQITDLHKDSATTKLAAAAAHVEAHDAHEEAILARRGLHEQWLWWTTKDRPWHQKVLEIIRSLDPAAAESVPVIPDPPIWDQPLGS